MVAKAHERFDAQGKPTDDKTRELVAKELQALVELVGRIKKEN